MGLEYNVIIVCLTEFLRGSYHLKVKFLPCIGIVDEDIHNHIFINIYDYDDYI